jgi:hypothetical protein
LRFGGLLSRRATAATGGTVWSLRRVGLWRTTIEASDASGTAIGVFRPRSLRRGGTINWEGREFELRTASAWRERYALVEDDLELALLDAKNWGKQPVTIEIADPMLVPPGLLLFAAFTARQLADDASATAGGVAAVAATG